MLQDVELFGFECLDGAFLATIRTKGASKYRVGAAVNADRNANHWITVAPRAYQLRFRSSLMRASLPMRA
jgi:hypothetical protein